jgi:serine/threonine protein kinase
MKNCGIRLDVYVTNIIIKKNLTSSLALLLIEKIIESLKALHSLGVMHGDVNPGNILVDDSECSEGDYSKLRVRFIDFGYSINLNTTTFDDFIKKFKIHPILPPEYKIFIQIESDNKLLKLLIHYINKLPHYPFYLDNEWVAIYNSDPNINYVSYGSYGTTFLAHVNSQIPDPEKSDPEKSKLQIPENIKEASLLYFEDPIYPPEVVADPKLFYTENNHENMLKRDFFQLGHMLFNLFFGEKDTTLQKIHPKVRNVYTKLNDNAKYTEIYDYIDSLTQLDYSKRTDKIEFESDNSNA